MPAVQPPPVDLPVLGPDGRMTPPWSDFFVGLQTGVDTGTAPADGRYLVATANGDLTNEVNLGALTTGLLRIAVALGIATVSSGLPALAQSSPADPTGTTSLTGVMMGLAGSITPTMTGRIRVVVCGTIFNANAIGDGANVQIRTGTGSAPANGDALTGTTAGGLSKYIAPTTACKVPFAVSAIVSGLTLNVARWIDVGLAATTAGTATITDLSVSAHEV